MSTTTNGSLVIYYANASLPEINNRNVTSLASKAPLVSSGKVAEASNVTAKRASTTATKKCGRAGHKIGASAYSSVERLTLLSIIRDILHSLKSSTASSVKSGGRYIVT